ncbi:MULTISPECIES: hypothetical protein [unclassified Fusibacter]|uniref:hypothetical protein n=1 Tax=unclassified Fusibacter TaxID=2624464 RepID=UPI00101255EF|nr:MULTISPECIES: hypothetical protein [unclassified Fusibacter]MCK8058566.1 hypothetical protein [Fusibacter sp. A2]NPE22665.1 hypothetical protein [Fusibacter sp. A1]RXV60228.1 hypothetical protein DWB64_12510 [Fusibacter sp. A1]
MRFKTKNFHLNQFFKVHAWQILITASLDIIGVFAALSIPLFLGRMITELEKGNATVHSLFVRFLTVVGLYVIWNVISLLVEVNFEVINKKIENQVRQHCRSL